jgi:nucleoside-diphosphate-sugar epimerase
MRKPAGARERAKPERPSRILLSGGTGFLGSHLAAALLDKGYWVTFLARARNGTSPEARVARLLDWLEVGEEPRARIRVVEADIARPGLGLAAAAAARVAAETDEIIHCASDTSFAERRRSEVEAANVGGLENVLELAAASRTSFLHVISTAYVAGRTAGLCPEAPINPAAFFNAYEETKCRAEAIARERCREEGIGLKIYRPSVVCGDSRTGRSLLFNAVYYPVRTALFLRDVFTRDLRERGGKRAAAMGVSFDGDGSVRLPIRIGVGEGEGVNIVPVDHFTAAFMALMEAPGDGAIYHIVNPRLKPVGELIAHATELFGLRGIEARPASELEGAPRNALESLYDGYLEAYGPYMRDRRIFGTEASGPILSDRGLSCPEFDHGVFSRCMTYAVSTGWGARGLPGAAPCPLPAAGDLKPGLI